MSTRQSCLELLDEAFHWLRQASAGTWLIYVGSAIPFLLLALSEWQELRSGRTEVIDPGALSLLAICYLLFGFGRSEFVRRLKGDIRQEANAHGGLRAVANHLLLNTAELALLPCALLSIVAFPWALAFFRFALCERETSLRKLTGDAARRASGFYRESCILTVILSAVALAVFLNLIVAALIFPDLFKALSGYETAFTRSRTAALNGTTIAAALGVSLLLCETLLLAFFDLVIFYQESQTSGRDLLLQLRAMMRGRRVTKFALLLLLLHFPAQAQHPTRPDSLANLDRRINQTLQERKYAWVGVTVKNEPARGGTWGPLLAIRKAIDGIADGVNRLLQSFVRWLDRLFSRRLDVPDQQQSPTPAKVPVWLLVCLGAAALAVAAVLLLRGRTIKPSGAPATASPTAGAQVEDEQTLASALPEQEWLRMADDYLQRGNGRLAVRALHLAELAVLADRGLVTISQFKTTADYREELRRRSRSQPAAELFAQNGLRYESTWYGLHEATRELIEGFGRDLESLRELTHA